MDAANLKIGRLQNEALNRQVEEFCKQSAAIATSFKDLL
jgi:hypothetical protein